MAKKKWYSEIQTKVGEYLEKWYVASELQGQDKRPDRVYETYLVKDHKAIFILIVVMHKSSKAFLTYKRDS